MEGRNFVLDGKAYPARVTMGALRLFRRETGEDFLKMQAGGDVTAEAIGVLLWASITSQCKREGVPFGYGCDDFFDMVSPDEVSAWFVGDGLHEEETDAESSKKKQRPE